MKLIDTHCHIHESEFFTLEQQDELYANAISEGVGMVCVGTSEKGSVEALEFVKGRENTWAVLGVHPHETKDGYAKIGELLRENAGEVVTKVVGIGEIGLDYFYFHAPREMQIAALEQQLQWAVDYDLPVSFHVRDYKTPDNASVWDDFWPIFDNFSGVRGVLHSFTDTVENLEKGLSRGLYVGVNGIATFARDRQEVYRQIPLERTLLETDAPFLTPVPFRGTMNEPKYVERVAAHVATLHGVSFEHVARITTDSAKRLFAI